MLRLDQRHPQVFGRQRFPAGRLDANPKAAKAYATLNSANRYSVLFRIHDAKRPATRVARIEKYVAMLAAGETIYG